MKVLVAVYPFITGKVNIEGFSFASDIWDHDPSANEIEEELVRGQYDGLLIGTKTVNKSIVDKNKSLKMISRLGVGLNNIDVEFFKKHDVITAYTPFGPTDSTAEMTIAMILAGTRRLTNYNAMMKENKWKREFGLRMMDATVGIVGFGRIGKRVATLLKPFGCTILLNDIKPDKATAHAMGWHFVNKEELLIKADIISFHVPLKEDTRDWLSFKEFVKLSRPVTIINTARGGIVNEQAVYGYLKDHPQSYFCCDAFVEEPYKGPLSELENCLLTPHASTFTVGSRKQTELQAIDNCIKVLKGEPCDYIVEKNE